MIVFFIVLMITSEDLYEFFAFSLDYQWFVFIGGIAAIMYIFQDRLGSYTFQPLATLQGYAAQPLLTLVLLVLMAGVLYLVGYGWERKPLFLRSAFLVIFPLQVILHILMGMPFELRVFIESLPVMVILAEMGVREWKQTQNHWQIAGMDEKHEYTFYDVSKSRYKYRLSKVEFCIT